MTSLLRILWLLLLVCSLSLSASPLKQLALQTPRPFGYVIGDIIHHRIIIELETGWQVQHTSIPQVSTLNRWLELRHVEVSQQVNESSVHYSLTLDYQVFYAPQAVKTLVIPAFKLLAEKNGESIELVINPWYFTLAPIRNLAVMNKDGSDYKRPDDAPDALPIASHYQRLVLFMLGALSAFAGFAYQYGWLPYGQHKQIFNRARKQVQSLLVGQVTLEPEENYEAGLKVVHTAFNTLYGQPLFAEQLSAFFVAHTEYANQRRDIEQFFSASSQFLFAQQHPDSINMADYSLQAMYQLCCHCRTIERSLR